MRIVCLALVLACLAHSMRATELQWSTNSTFFEDPDARLHAIGLDRLPSTEGEAKLFLTKNFPILIGSKPQSIDFENATEGQAAFAEYVRFIIFARSIQERGLLHDRMMLRVMLGFFDCADCTSIVRKVEKFLPYVGCGGVVTILFGGICRTIPFVNSAIVSQCVDALRLGCSKLINYIERRVSNSTQLCCDALNLCCTSGFAAAPFVF